MLEPGGFTGSLQMAAKEKSFHTSGLPRCPDAVGVGGGVFLRSALVREEGRSLHGHVVNQEALRV